MRKKLYVLFAATIVVMSVFFISCGDNNNNDPIDTTTVIKASENIVGNWNYIKKAHTSDKTYETAATGSLIIKKDGTFTMTGDIIKELTSYDGDLSGKDISGNYTFTQGNLPSWGTLNIYVDDKYKTEKIWSYSWDLETEIYEDGGIYMTLRHEWKQGQFLFNDKWYFKKSLYQ